MQILSLSKYWNFSLLLSPVLLTRLWVLLSAAEVVVPEFQPVTSSLIVTVYPAFLSLTQKFYPQSSVCGCEPDPTAWVLLMCWAGAGAHCSCLARL